MLFRHILYYQMSVAKIFPPNVNIDFVDVPSKIEIYLAIYHGLTWKYRFFSF